MARLSIDASLPGVVALDASRRVPPRPIGLIWHRDASLSDAAETFLAASKARCDELASEFSDDRPARML